MQAEFLETKFLKIREGIPSLVVSLYKFFFSTSVLDHFVCWVIFIFACPVKVMVKSCYLRISEISWGNFLKKSKFSKSASSLKLCNNKQTLEKTFSWEFSQIFRILILKKKVMVFLEPKNSSCKSIDGSGTPAISEMEFLVTLVSF